MSDYAQICELFARYAAAIDGRDHAMLRDVLTDDARFVSHIAGGPTVGPFESGDAVVKYISGTAAMQHGQRRHVMTNVWRREETAYALVSLLETASGWLSVLTKGGAAGAPATGLCVRTPARHGRAGAGQQPQINHTRLTRRPGATWGCLPRRSIAWRASRTSASRGNPAGPR